jgi:hypothetical protein
MAHDYFHCLQDAEWKLRTIRLELCLEAMYITADPDYEAKVVAIDAEIARISEILKRDDHTGRC